MDNLQDVEFVVGIAAGKGGVGKSTLTVNLGLALQELGYAVGILDADIYGPSLQTMLPLTTSPSYCEPSQEERMLPGICGELKVISMAHFGFEKRPSIVRAPLANGVIQQFLHQVDWGKLTYLLIDFPPGTGDIPLTLMQKECLAGGIVVTTPQEVALLDVRKALQMYEEMQVPVLGVVENMSYFPDPLTKKPHYLFGKGGGEKLAEEFGVPFLGSIPLDPLISSCGDQGISLFSQEGAESQEPFRTIAENMRTYLQLVKEEERGALGDFELLWEQRDE